jgi:hypothetical protein
VTARLALITLTIALVAAAPAGAAEITVRVSPKAGVRLGNPSEVTGRVTEGGAPLGGRVVDLEVRRHPFTGNWTGRGTARTRADGSFSFSTRLDRNHQVRIRLEAVGADSQYAPPGQDTISGVRNAYVLPAFTLRFRQRGRRAIRIVQTYTVPRAVRLTAPTRFYVGPCKPDAAGLCTAKRAQLRATAKTRRVRAGRFVARATVRIPKSFKGRFRYVSCFGYSKGSGMGDPSVRCPRKSIRLR